MKKILVVGAFGYDNNQLDGQTVKTRSVYELLEKRSQGKVSYIDTLSLRRKPYLLFALIYRLLTCNTLIVLPALNNLTYLFPAFYYLSKIFKYEIVHICIGGWQIEYFWGLGNYRRHLTLLRMTKKIKAFLPEMDSVNEYFVKNCGFTNTEVLYNFRAFNRPPQTISNEEGLRLVFMARIHRMKGYDVIFNSIDYLRQNCPGCKVDFYGWINPEDETDFLNKIEAFSDVAEFKGTLTPDVIHQTLAQYDVLLLPTKFYTEGFPGSILDAYIAGIPVVVSEWKHSREFVKDGDTGIIVPFEDNQNAFNAAILSLCNDRNKLNEMKQKAYMEANKYSEDTAWSILERYI